MCAFTFGIRSSEAKESESSHTVSAPNEKGNVCIGKDLLRRETAMVFRVQTAAHSMPLKLPPMRKQSTKQ